MATPHGKPTCVYNTLDISMNNDIILSKLKIAEQKQEILAKTIEIKSLKTQLKEQEIQLQKHDNIMSYLRLTIKNVDPPLPPRRHPPPCHLRRFQVDEDKGLSPPLSPPLPPPLPPRNYNNKDDDLNVYKNNYSDDNDIYIEIE